jgi:hypothetical protein
MPMYAPGTGYSGIHHQVYMVIDPHRKLFFEDGGYPGDAMLRTQRDFRR